MEKEEMIDEVPYALKVMKEALENGFTLPIEMTFRAANSKVQITSLPAVGGGFGPIKWIVKGKWPTDYPLFLNIVDSKGWRAHFILVPPGSPDDPAVSGLPPQRCS